MMFGLCDNIAIIAISIFSGFILSIHAEELISIAFLAVEAPVNI